jgi:CRISPR-associated protein Cmr5
MNKNISKYIETAMAVLNTEVSSNGKLKKEYKGYISSLGASMIMSGLVPTMAFYASKENSAKAQRWKVLDWIFSVLRGSDRYSNVSASVSLFQYSLQQNTDIKTLEKDIQDVSIALKLCIRTFELVK